MRVLALLISSSSVIFRCFFRPSATLSTGGGGGFAGSTTFLIGVNEKGAAANLSPGVAVTGAPVAASGGLASLY